MQETDRLPLISIITVTYNAVLHLEKCINSIISQHYPRIEHIIIDGGSTDGTLEVIKSHPGNLAYWVSERDNGIYDAMNKALSHIHGEWVYFLGADDTLYPEFSDLAKKLKDRNTIYYGQCTWGEMILGGVFTPKRLIHDCICHHSVLYPRRVFERYIYNLKYKIGADHLLNIQCWTDQTIKKEYHPFIIANFAQGGLSQQDIDEKFKKDFPLIILKYYGLFHLFRYWYKRTLGKF
ncbi:glycosyltransferase family 2 protein [Desertivirga arenae]|uniref:glycosyltransferase family 2 protein n=1 Tax=Desertivirga arenae TaxID=2810309 RepID=UPI001A977A59|nr:glycosyltransferase family 2 protein [Pedobacter sp. SYSU D00823]